MTIRLLRMAWRQHREGNNKPLQFIASRAWIGLTHWHCFKCRKWKGPTLRRYCEDCAAANVIRNIFGQEYP